MIYGVRGSLPSRVPIYKYNFASYFRRYNLNLKLSEDLVKDETDFTNTSSAPLSIVNDEHHKQKDVSKVTVHGIRDNYVECSYRKRTVQLHNLPT